MGVWRFNRAVLNEIGESLRKGELRGVVLSGRWSSYFRSAGTWR